MNELLNGSGTMSSLMPNFSTRSRSRDNPSTDQLSSKSTRRQCAANVVDAESGQHAQVGVRGVMLMARFQQRFTWRSGMAVWRRRRRARRLRRHHRRESVCDSSASPSKLNHEIMKVRKHEKDHESKKRRLWLLVLPSFSYVLSYFRVFVILFNGNPARFRGSCPVLRASPAARPHNRPSPSTPSPPRCVDPPSNLVRGSAAAVP